MEVILDELTPMEFFAHGGIVKLNVTNQSLIDECGLKKKYTFFDYKSYMRFFRNTYLKYLTIHPDKKSYDVCKIINDCMELKSTIGHSLYVVDLEYNHSVSYESAKFYYSGDELEQNVLPRDPYGIKNVCFSQISEDYDKWDEYEKQRLERGFDDSEVWSFDGTISKFIYPRLKVFFESVKKVGCHPETISLEKWLKILETVINGFELLAQDRIKTDEECKLEKEAIKLFSEYFFELYT